MDETRVKAREQGYVETVFGRRLWLPEIKAGNGPRRAGAERQAINAPMQGTAADLIKLAMIAVQGALDDEQRATRMVMQVHDELVLEVPDAELRLGARGDAAPDGRRGRAEGAAAGRGGCGARTGTRRIERCAGVNGVARCGVQNQRFWDQGCAPWT